MTTITNPRSAPIAQALEEVGRYLTDQDSRIAEIEKETASLRAELREVYERLYEAYEQLRKAHEQDRERIRVIDNTLDLVRHDTTRKRDLPTESDFAVFQLASDYTQFVETDLMALAGHTLPVRRARPVDDTPLEEHEARAARKLAIALLLRDPGPDLDAVAALFEGPSAQLEDAVRRAGELRARMAEHGARFDPVAEGGASSEGLRLWAACRAGAVRFVVAPALMVGGRTIADSEGKSAGPWVYTTEIGTEPETRTEFAPRTRP